MMLKDRRREAIMWKPEWRCTRPKTMKRTRVMWVKSVIRIFHFPNPVLPDRNTPITRRDFSALWNNKEFLHHDQYQEFAHEREHRAHALCMCKRVVSGSPRTQFQYCILLF